MRGEEVRRRVRPRRTIACKGLVVASVFAFACLRLMAFCGAEAYSLSLDGKALLELKASISRDPGGVLSDWKDGGRGPCSWTGVTCDAALNRVVALNISGGLSCQAGGFSSSSSAFGEGNNGYSASASAASCARFLQVHSPGTGFPGGCAGAGAFPESVPAIGAPLGSEICLRNGSASNSSAGYNSGGDRVACRLTGKLPPSIGNLTELRVLSLPYNAFYGEIPGELGRLRVLEVLELQGNSLTGGVPSELGELNSLRVLNLGYNSLVGTIPETLGRCRSLETLNLAGNMLKGTIPPVLGSLLRLRLLSLSFNQLSGPIRVELFGSCQLLEHLHLSGNLLTGTIPAQLGNCPSLRSVSLFSNFLQESIPRELGRLSLLEILDVSRNILSGEIPKELGNCLRLSVLVLTNLLDYDLAGNYTAIDPASGLSNNEKGEFNYFEGDVPTSVLMLPRLQILWAPRATLNGPLPEDWGDCHSLQILNLGQNLLSGEIPAGLGQCKSLIFLDLSSNRLEGSIPNLPISCMLYFNVSGNSLSGNISNSVKFDCPGHPLFAAYGGLLDISQAEVDPTFLYSSLFYCGTRASSPLASFVSEGLMVFHDLSRNNFTNHLPPPLVGDRLMKEQPSYGLFLNNNHFIGNISSPFFASCQGFQSLSLNLSGNQISGEIPAQVLGDCKSLKLLDAAFNHITGSVPSTLGNLSSLQYLDLSINDLQGSIPPQLGQLKDLQYLVLAENNMSGAIPEELGQLTSLLVLDLSSNALTGKIPEDLVKLRQLKGLFLEKNQLSGQIPGGFENLTALAMFNLSFNNLSGRMPHMGKSVTCDSFKGNNFLQPCQSASSSSHQQEQTRGPLPYASPPAASSSEGHGRFNSIEIAALTSAAAIIFVLAVLVVLFQYTRRCIPNPPGYQGGRKEVVTFTNIGVQLSYEHVVRATGNFSIGNLIGNGGFGATYKAELTPGLLVAVKRLSIGKFQGIQQFDTEIRTLGRIRHPNLVTLIGYHASESEMFLIYNYLPGGNLESFIHEKSTRNADWCILHKIALDIAQALAYLHDECVPRVLHRDIKPSNILLDNNLNAYLSDFGLARLLGASETHATTDVAGTFGYLAPEYAMTCRVSDKADVYSYGVVLLELLSGKKALDPSFSCYGNGFNIVAWACMLLRDGRARELYTPGLWDVGPHDDLVEALHLAVTCTVDSLSIRPLMRQVVQRLKQIQPPPVS